MAGLGLIGLVGLIASPVAAKDLPHLTVPKLHRAPVLNEFLDMKGPNDLTSVMAHVDTFTQREPVDGEPAGQQTDAYLGYDDKNFYAVFVCFEDDPGKIRAHLARRENVFGDDIVGFQIDTFLDRQRAFYFIVNPLGIQLDALWTENGGGPESSLDLSWDAVWQSQGQITDRGYVVLISVPFRSLRFPPSDEQTWGIVILRDAQHNDQDTFWPPISQRIEGRMNQAATIDGIRGISGGGNNQVIPYVTARNFEAIDTVDEPTRVKDSFDPDGGVDAKIVFKDSLALDLTANPDFSQIESDQPQVTVNERFEVFFPERRPFFMENAPYFQTPLNLLFTRRIADPRAGARLTGKVGKYAVAAMVIDDESPGKAVPSTDPLYDETAVFGVLRAIRDVGKQSRVGLFFTDRELDDQSNRVFSADARLKLTENWVGSFQAATSSTDPGGGGSTRTDEAFNVSIDHTGRHYNSHNHYFDVGPEFETQAGFIERSDVRNLHTRQSWTFWPEGDKLISWTPQGFAGHVQDHDGQWLERRYEADVELEFRRSTKLELSFLKGDDFLRPQDLSDLVESSNPSLPPVFLQGLAFDRRENSVEFDSRLWAAFGYEVRFAKGQGINFVPAVDALPSSVDTTSSRVEATLRLTQPTRLTFSYLGTRLEDRASGTRVLTNSIGRARFDWQLTPKWSLRAILEREATDVNPLQTRLEQSRRLNGDLLATYLVNPWTALYLGYNNNRRNQELILNPLGNQLVNTGTDLNKDADQIFVKFSYLFQL